MDLRFVHVDLLEGGDDERSGLACAILGTCEDVALSEGGGDGFLLDGRRLLKAGFKDTHEKFAAKEHVLELDALSRSYIFGLRAIIFWWWAKTRFPGVSMAKLTVSGISHDIVTMCTHDVEEEGRACWDI